MAKQEEQLIFTSEKIEEIKIKADNGFKISRQEKYWLSSQFLVRKPNLVFKRTTEETLEYFKCKLGVDTEGRPFLDPEKQTLQQEGIEYFSEKFCKIKREDGTVGKMKLRDYQEDILNLYMKNRFSILIASRQVGKCISLGDTVQIEGSDVPVPLFKILFKYKSDRGFYDYIKYGLYYMIDVLEN